MPQRYSLFSLASLFSALFLIFSAVTLHSVEIPDFVLERRIREALDKPEGEITQADMDSLITLNAQGRPNHRGTTNSPEDPRTRIIDLDGLELARNLTSLILSHNSITDLSPLKGLANLTDLDLTANPFSDFNQLSELISLKTLTLPSENLGDVSFFSELKTLTSLTIFNGGISDLSPFSQLSGLTSLTLVSNPVSDLSPLRGLTSLTHLSISAAEIRDLSALSELTSLTLLSLFNNEISDLTPLSGLSSLSKLYLIANNITDLNPIADLVSLTELDLTSNSISDLSPISNMKELRLLRVGSTEITDLSPLSGLTALEELTLWFSPGIDLSPLSGLSELTTLSLGGQISDLSFLNGLTKLIKLELSRNLISDLNPLRNLTSLTELILDRNLVNNLSPLSSLTALNILNLDFNKISDLSPLAGLTDLSVLNLDFNNINDLSPLSNLTDLKSLSLRFNQIFDLRPLQNLTNLTGLSLSDNNIFLIDALAGLTKLEVVNIGNNYLDLLAGSEALAVIDEIRGFDPRWISYEPQKNLFAGISLLDDLNGELDPELLELGTLSDNPDLFDLEESTAGFSYVQKDTGNNQEERQVLKRLNGIAYFDIDWAVAVNITLNEVGLSETGENIGLGFKLSNNFDPEDILIHTVNLVAKDDESGNLVLQREIETSFFANSDSPEINQSPELSRTVVGNQFILFLFWVAEKHTLLAAYDAGDGQLDGVSFEIGSIWEMDLGDTFDLSLVGLTNAKTNVEVGTLFFTNLQAMDFEFFPLNDYAPVAVDDLIRVPEGETISFGNLLVNGTDSDLPMDSITFDAISFGTLLANDTDGDLPMDSLTINVIPVSGPTFGSLTLAANGTFTYAHDDSENFTDSFIYEVIDSFGATGTGLVTITIIPQDETGLFGYIRSDSDTIDSGLEGTITTTSGNPNIPGSRVSSWYLNYNVFYWPWIEHEEHGWQFIHEDDAEEGIFIWDLGLGGWLFVNPEAYRWIYLYGDNPGWIWTFPDNTPEKRYFQRFDDRNLFSVPVDLPVE